MLRIGLLFLIVFLTSTLLVGQNPEKKELKAKRITEPPTIDAELNETIWSSASVASDFIQLRPENGESASFASAIKIIYDDDAVYVGAALSDPHPDSIYTELSERDQITITDYFGVYFDCFNDNLTAYGFFVTAAGVQVDMKSTLGNGEDNSWDAVWQSASKIDESGWIVEMRIPYSALRMPKKDIQTWGLQFFRNIMRYRENSSWNFIDLEEDGFNQQAGILTGISNIKPPLRLSFVPYVSGYLEKSPNTRSWGYSYNYGLDLKYGINESYTLDMTLVPDFGQTESDDEIYNLSPFEVYYDEKRPFFTEGTELFDKGNVFYSRRIGQEPSGYSEVEDKLTASEKINDNPQNAQLINATKISGKSRKNLAIGVFNAMTANTYAEIKDTLTGNKRRELTEPFTNYNMLVLDQSLKNNSYVSFFNTNVYKPDGKTASNVSGGQLKLNNKENSYGIWAEGILSQKYSKALTPDFGHRYSLVAGKLSGNFTFEYSHDVIDQKFDPNDMGFLRHNNLISNYIRFSYNIYKPFWKVLNWHNNIWFNHDQLFSPRTFTHFSMGFRSRTTFKNHLTVWANGSLKPVTGFNYYEPRIENRCFESPANYNIRFGFSPDYRKKFLIDWKVGFFNAFNDNNNSYWFSIEPRFRVNDQLMIVLEMEYDRNNNDKGYVTDSLNLQSEDVIIFGSRNIDTYETTLDADFRFSNKSSISLRLRHYWINVVYNEYYDLMMEGSLIQSNYNSLHDFGVNIFNIDLQYIWNFAPGSELRAVWKNAIDTFDEPLVNSNYPIPLETNYVKNLSNTLQTAATNSFSIKLLYYIDYHVLSKQLRGKNPKSKYPFI